MWHICRTQKHFCALLMVKKQSWLWSMKYGFIIVHGCLVVHGPKIIRYSKVITVKCYCKTLTARKMNDNCCWIKIQLLAYWTFIVAVENKVKHDFLDFFLSITDLKSFFTEQMTSLKWPVTSWVITQHLKIADIMGTLEYNRNIIIKLGAGFPA